MSDTGKLTHAIVEFYEKLSSWEHDVVREQGLTLPQTHTLEILGIHGALPMKELAARMGVTTGTLTVLVDRLEDKQLVVRRPHEHDRRSILVALTERGQTQYEEHDRLHRRLTGDLTADLTAEQKAALLHCLETMNSSF